MSSPTYAAFNISMVSLELFCGGQKNRACTADVSAMLYLEFLLLNIIFSCAENDIINNYEENRSFVWSKESRK